MCNVTEIHIERVTRAHWLSYHCSDVQLLEVLRMGRQGWRESWWGISPNWSWYWPVASVSASVFVLCSLKLSAYNLDFTKNVRGYRREDWAHSKVKKQLPFTISHQCKDGSLHIGQGAEQSSGDFQVSHYRSCCCVSLFYPPCLQSSHTDSLLNGII